MTRHIKTTQICSSERVCCTTNGSAINKKAKAGTEHSVFVNIHWYSKYTYILTNLMTKCPVIFPAILRFSILVLRRTQSNLFVPNFNLSICIYRGVYSEFYFLICIVDSCFQFVFSDFYNTDYNFRWTSSDVYVSTWNSLICIPELSFPIYVLRVVDFLFLFSEL